MKEQFQIDLKCVDDESEILVLRRNLNDLQKHYRVLVDDSDRLRQRNQELMTENIRYLEQINELVRALDESRR